MENNTVKNYARTSDVQELPSLIEVQLQSFNWFIEEGLAELFDEISPIESFNGNLRLYLPGKSPEAEQFGLTYWFEEPKHTKWQPPEISPIIKLYLDEIKAFGAKNRK